MKKTVVIKFYKIILAEKIKIIKLIFDIENRLAKSNFDNCEHNLPKIPNSSQGNSRKCYFDFLGKILHLVASATKCSKSGVILLYNKHLTCRLLGRVRFEKRRA